MDTIRITIESNAEDAAKTFEDLSKAFEDSTQSSEDLRKQIKGLKDDIYKLTPGTEEYSKKLQELGAKMNTLGDIQRDLKASSGGLDDVFSTTTKAVGTMASGFQAAAGIVTLFGKESSDLQKTFIKLQSVMAIAQGLQGFSGFIKYTETASASVKAFVNKLKLSTAAVKADTTEKSANATATKGLAVAENTAAASTVGLAGAFNKLKAAIASNPIGIIIVALTTVIGLVGRYNRKMDERLEREKALNKVLGERSAKEMSQVDYYREEAEKIEDTASKLQTLGATQEDVNKYREEALSTMKDENEEWLRKNKELRDNINYANQLLLIENNSNLTEEERTRYLEEGRKAMDAFNKEYDERLALAEEWDKLEKERKKDTEPFKYYNKSISEAKKNLQELVELGKISQKQANEELIASLRLKIGSLQNYRGNDQGEIALRKQQIKEYQEQIAELQKDIEKIDDKARQEAQKNWQDRVANSKKAMESLLSELQETNKKLTEKVSSEVGNKSLLDAMFGINEDGTDTAAIRIRKSAVTLYAEYKKAFDDFIAKAQADGSLLNKDLATVTAQAEEYMQTLEKVFKDNGMDPSFLTEDVKAKVDEVQGLVDTFTKANEGYKQMLESGQITMEEYQTWLIDAYKNFVQSRNKALEGQSDEMIKALAGVNISASVKSEVESEISGILDDILNGIEDEYENKLDGIEVKYMGESDNIWTKLFGIPDLSRMKAQLKEAEAALEEMYTQEMTELDSQLAYAKSVYGEEAAEYKALKALKLRLYKKYLKEKKELQDKEKEDEEETWQDVTKKVSSTASAVGSFASAMSDYYDEMANNEKEGSKKQKEYTIKSLKAQKYQTIATTAAGMVSAVVSAIQSLGFPAGPIVGGIEAAALAVMAAAQIKSINRQIKEVGGSAGGDDVQAAGMMDRVITANTQNTDQTAQLNAQYIGDEMEGATKVYVTQNDISDAQNKNRVAVTQNGF